jgi:predicted phosphoribosyltransferase
MLSPALICRAFQKGEAEVTASIFADRKAAGEQLAESLIEYKDRDALVLALPRGGVPVAFELAKALNAPLDVILVRKIGAPGQPELAAGAVVDGGSPETVINEDVKDALGIEDSYIEEESARQLAEIERCRKLYIGDRSRPEIAGKTVIVVDDGIATGATVRAAVHAVRRRSPERLVLAVPVAPPDSVESLRGEVDELICLHTPTLFGAISLYYNEFHQLDDEEVASLLGKWSGSVSNLCQ